MSHETENPLIIDVVGEVEPVDSPQRQSSKKPSRSTGKKWNLFKKDKAASGATATSAASEADVNAAKRAATAAAVPPVQGPIPEKRTVQSAPIQSAEPETTSAAQAQSAPAVVEAPAQPVPSAQEAGEPVMPSEPLVEAVESTYRPAEATPQTKSVSEPAPQERPSFRQSEQPHAYVPGAEPPQASVPEPEGDPIPIKPKTSRSQQPAPSVAAREPVQCESQPQPQPQPEAAAPQPPHQPQFQPQSQTAVPPQPPASQPASQPTATFVPAAPIRQANRAAAVEPLQQSTPFYVFGILAVAVVVLALMALVFYFSHQDAEQTLLAPTSQVDQDIDEMELIVSGSLDQVSRVSIRSTAEGWSEDASTPAIAYIKRVEDASEESSSEGTTERYFAFTPNQIASVSLPAGRYAISFIPPVNSDGSLYTGPDVVNMVIGEEGMAVLPVDFMRLEKDDVTQEQILRVLAQLKTASTKGDSSFENDAFTKAIDHALSDWFPQYDSTSEQPAAELTEEQQEVLNAQADARDVQQSEGSSSGSSSTHSHVWVAQHESHWEPAIGQVVDTPAWESPVYAAYRCQGGVLFETLEECLEHVRERGNESYEPTNEIIRVDYHPAVVHYEDQGQYVDVVTGYRCSVCGIQASL